jgi:hypothetical protein
VGAQPGVFDTVRQSKVMVANERVHPVDKHEVHVDKCESWWKEALAWGSLSNQLLEQHL